MLEKIAGYWVLWVMGLLATAILGVWRGSSKKVSAVNNGVKAILHDRLFQAHRYYMTQGWCSLEDKKNIEYLYLPYHDLGGNGTGTSIYHDIMDLPTFYQNK